MGYNMGRKSAEVLMEPEILYRDKNIVVCVKPVGVSSESGGMPELLNNGGDGIFCVHRLDKAVGGVMVYACDRHSAAKLSAQVADRRLNKEYLAVVSGSIAEKSGTMTDLLFHDAAKNKSYVVKRERKGVKPAELDYEVLEEKDGLSLVRIKLKTGRSHQIRVQFASRGFPLVGDVKYGSTVKDQNIALWSAALSFSHPATNKTVEFRKMPDKNDFWSKFDIIQST